MRSEHEQLMDRPVFFSLLVFSFMLLFLYIMYQILNPFFAPLTWAIIIGIATYPVYLKILSKISGRKEISAALMMVLVVVVIVLPLTAFGAVLAQELSVAYDFFQQLGDGQHSFMQNLLTHPSVVPLVQKAKPLTDRFGYRINTDIIPAVNKGVGFLLGYLTAIVKNSFVVILDLFIMIITLFFIYRDGDRLAHNFWRVMPVTPENREMLVGTVKRVVAAVIYGVFFTCLVQGTLGGIGFAIAGLPSPILFGSLMVVTAIIPAVGTALIWVPGVLYLFFSGNTGMGIFLLLWGVVVISSIDNVIRPIFISGRGNIHILVTAIGGLGGLAAFGFTGIVAGPLLLALFIDFFGIYASDVFRSHAPQIPQPPAGE